MLLSFLFKSKKVPVSVHPSVTLCRERPLDSDRVDKLISGQQSTHILKSPWGDIREAGKFLTLINKAISNQNGIPMVGNIEQVMLFDFLMIDGNIYSDHIFYNIFIDQAVILFELEDPKDRQLRRRLDEYRKYTQGIVHSLLGQ